MRNAEFKQRALAETLRYGEDRFVFLRELAQNARDAGANRILVQARWSSGNLVVTFEDDGRGMTRQHARSFLFRLYASSKEDEARSAGRFGVGFWSVLLFEPDLLRVESKRAHAPGWSLETDGDLIAPRQGEAHLKSPGTKVLLEKHDPDPSSVETIGRALESYCRHLRRSDEEHVPLPVFFNGEAIHRPFAVPGPCQLAFSDGPVEGVVGLGESPSIELYAKGLLVWRGALLDELRYGRVPSKRDYHQSGLSPVYKLNGNRLNVTLDRRFVVDDKELYRVRSAARLYTRRLLARYLDALSPRPLPARFKDALGTFWEELRLRKGLRLALALGAAATLGILAGVLFLNHRHSDETAQIAPSPGASPTALQAEPPPLSLGAAFTFRGPSVDPLGRMGRLSLAYAPAEPVELRTAAFESLHPHTGVLSSREGAGIGTGSSPSLLRCVEDCFDIAVKIRGPKGRAVPLPVPTGYGFVTGSDRLEGSAKIRLLEIEGIAHAVFTGEGGGTLSYRAAPLPPRRLPPKRLRRLLEIPDGMTLPLELERLADEARGEPSVPLRVEKIAKYVRDRILYDRSTATAQTFFRFFERPSNRGWLDFVLALGRGDCDVKNTLALTVLRRAGVPARLAIGVIGDGGEALPGFHAWVEYRHGDRWRAVDATDSPGLAASDLAPSAGEEDARKDAPPIANDPARQETSSASLRGRYVTDERILIFSAGLFGTAAVALFAMGLLGFLRRGSRASLTTDETRSRRDVAAKMLAGAIAEPKAWSGAGGIVARPLLPTVDGRRISFRRASRLARRGRLWYAREPLDVPLKGRGVVLDATDRAFKDVISRVPGVQDLTELLRLVPRSPRKDPEEHAALRDLVADANSRLARLGFPEKTLAVCAAPHRDCVADVDLTGAGVELPNLPRRYVAVCAGHERAREVAELAKKNRPAATLALLDLVLERSELLSPYAEKIRFELALELIARAL